MIYYMMKLRRTQKNKIEKEPIRLDNKNKNKNNQMMKKKDNQNNKNNMIELIKENRIEFNKI